MLDDLTRNQIALLRQEYDQLKTKKQQDDYINKIVDSVYENRHQLYEFWALQKEEKAPVVKMPSHTSPTKSAKIIGVKNYEHSNKHKF